MSRYEPTRGQLYGWKWQKARKLYLARYPLCRMCKAQGKLTASTVVDHIKPHKGDPALFWSQANWQALCEGHHNSAKQAQEKSGKLLGIGAEGMPTHPDHPWNN